MQAEEYDLSCGVARGGYDIRTLLLTFT